MPDEIDRELWSVSFSLAGRHQRSLSCMQLFSHKLASTGLLLAASSLIILLFQSWIDCCFSHQLLFRGTSVQPRDENFQILATPVNAFIQLLLLTGNAALWIIQMHMDLSDSMYAMTLLKFQSFVFEPGSSSLKKRS